MTNTTIGRTGSLWRLLAVALVMVLACGGLALALTAKPSEAALRAFDGGAVSSGDGDYATHPANAAAIPIPAGGPSSLYPSQIDVSGVSGSVSHVTVRLDNYGHTWPDDVDVMLAGPGGQGSLVMSDVGGLTGVTDLNLTLNDEAANPMPDGATLATGVYKPTNVDGVADFPDIFPAPALVPGGWDLSAFDGTNPNGTWSLYVVDDLAGHTGGFTGWSLRVTANEAPNAANDAFAVREDRTLNRGVLGNDADPDGDMLTAVRVSGPRHGRLTLGANGSFSYRPARNFNGRDSFVYEALDGRGGTDRATVNIRVKAAPR